MLNHNNKNYDNFFYYLMQKMSQYGTSQASTSEVINPSQHRTKLDTNLIVHEKRTQRATPKGRYVPSRYMQKKLKN